MFLHPYMYALYKQIYEAKQQAQADASCLQLLTTKTTETAIFQLNLGYWFPSKFFSTFCRTVPLKLNGIRVIWAEFPSCLQTNSVKTLKKHKAPTPAGGLALDSFSI